MESKISEIGPWKKIGVLGSGGFGQVILWYNSTTNQNIAIKKLHEQVLKDDSSRGKQIERWCKEVEIMKKLSHVNIVSTLKIPEGFQSLSNLPLLVMEYCSLGDLRRILNKPENCSGLEESAVLNILKDVSNGLAYLHSSKIIHRDLKPDNIVLQAQDSNIVYKLIDLGYAKAFDQSSLSQSFVGTIQYIAPELFLGKAYTSSVDYWSFGLLTYEIITGHRPFLPGFNPTDWMRQIQNKARNIISVLENADGDIVFSSTISRRNRISSCYLNDIEKWLQLALDWDGQTRGRDPQKNRPIIFEELGNILNKKVIKIFSVHTYTTLAYEVNSETDISDVRKWLKEDTGLEVDSQLLLMPSGKSLNMRGNLLNGLKEEKVQSDKPAVFLYNGGLIVVRNNAWEKSKYIEELIELSQRTLRYRHLKRCCADSIWFLQAEAAKYKNLLQGIEVKIANTKNKTLAIESLYEDVGNEWDQVESYSQFLSISHKIDLENYINFRKAGKLKASPLVKKWIQNVIEVDKKIAEVKGTFNKNEQKQLVLMARQRCRNLDTHPGNSNTQKTVFDDIVNESYKLWENVQRLPREGKGSWASNIGAVSLINKTTKECEKLFDNQTLQSLFLKISEADENLARFLTHLTILSKSIKILKLVIENTQKERQIEIWHMIANVKEIPGRENGKLDDKIENNNLNNNNNNNNNNLSEVNDLTADSKNIMSNSEIFGKQKGEVQNLSNSLLASSLSLKDSLDASSIINDNNQLRYSMQDIQQNLTKMIKDFSSLDFNFRIE